jgi:hypothetical protein
LLGDHDISLELVTSNVECLNKGRWQMMWNTNRFYTTSQQMGLRAVLVHSFKSGVVFLSIGCRYVVDIFLIIFPALVFQSYGMNSTHCPAGIKYGSAETSY